MSDGPRKILFLIPPEPTEHHLRLLDALVREHGSNAIVLGREERPKVEIDPASLLKEMSLLETFEPLARKWSSNDLPRKKHSKKARRSR